MKRVVIFYLSENPGPGRSPVIVDDGSTVYVRAEVAPKTFGLVTALDHATPARDEQVMNTHRLHGWAVTA